jgi:hypothetical protein
MNEHDGQVKLTLEFAQKGEQRADLRGVVFVDAMQTDQGIQDEQDGLVLLDGLSQALPVSGGVQSQGGCGDDFDGQCFKIHLSSASDPLEALTHHREGVFGWKDQHFAGAANWELAQTGCAGSHADGYIQGEKAFAAFGFAAKDANGLIGPKALDQPLSLRAGAGKLTGPLHGKRKSFHNFFGRFGIQGEDLKIEFFIDQFAFLLTGDG